MIEVHGHCPDQFAAVRDAFAANFDAAPEGLNELAARFSACIDGELVVDIWAGHADTARSRPFEADTLVPVFSTGKAVMSLMIAHVVERGLVAYDQPVAEVWPEFGQAGKDQVTLAQMMSHQAGLPGFSDSIEPSLWFDRQAVVERLAAQAPMWPPGTASGYHPITIGFLAGEVFRRVDGRSMGQALREDFAEPFGLDLWIGLPEDQHDRVAQLRKPTAAPDLGTIDAIKRSAFLDRGSSPGGRGSAEWRMAEIPSANLHGRADALARILGIVATGGVLDGKRVLSGLTLAQLTKERIRGRDLVVPFEMSWAAGVMRNETLKVFGPTAEAIGHSGWGGSMAMADPARGVSAAYVMSRQSPHLIGDPRSVRLIEALYAAL